MNALSALVVVAALGQTPVDRAELAKAQTALEAYLSGIKTLQITYTEKWTPSDPEAYQRENDTWDPTLSNDHDLLYAFPSVRMKNLERRRDVEGQVKEHQWDSRVHNGQRTDIDYTAKQFHIRTKLDSDPYPSLPIDSFGLRVNSTQNTPLSDLLKFPDITSLEGEEKIDGERVIVWKIGPKIPETVRPKYWTDSAFLRVSLAPERNYLPLVLEIYPSYKAKAERCWRYSIGSLRAVSDKSRDRTVLFPHRMEIVWPNGGRTAWVVQSAVINPKVSDDDFVITPPAGYFVTTDGRTGPLRPVEPDPNDASMHPLSVTVLNDQGKPVAGAKLALWNIDAFLVDMYSNESSSQAKPIRETSSDGQGKATFQSFPLSGLSLVSRHDEYRTTSIRQIGDNRVAVLRLSPKTPVVVRDEQGQPVKGIAVGVDLMLTADHSLCPLFTDFETAHRTGDDGKAVITWEVPQRRSHDPCAFLATNRSGTRVAIAVRPPNELRKVVELTLGRTRLVRAAVDLGAATMTGPDIRWADAQGRVFYSGSSTRVGEHPAQFESRLRLPPGAYQIMIVKPPDAEATLPFAVAPGKDELDLGVVALAPSRLAQLNGSEAPELSVRWPAGAAKRLADLRGKVVVLYFWATWCGPCLQRMPEMMALKEKLGKEPVEWIAIHDASVEDIAELDERLPDLGRQFWDGKPLSLPTVLDEVADDGYRGATISKYGVRSWPTVVLIDREGKVVAPVEKDKLELTIRNLLK